MSWRLPPSVRRPVWSLVGLLVAYFAFPVSWDTPTLGLVIGVALTVLGLGVLGRMMVLEIQNLRHGRPGRRTSALVMMLVLVVMTFSLTFYLVELINPDQFVGMETRIDSLYFTLSTMSTVGFGDVHAQGQVARTLVSGLIIFNVAIVATLARVLTHSDRPLD